MSTGATLAVNTAYTQTGSGSQTSVEGTLSAASLDVEGGSYTNDTGVTNLGTVSGTPAVGSINIGSNGTLTDNAAIFVGASVTPGTVNNAGTVSIGSPGTLTLLDGGTYTQTGGTTDVNGTLTAPTVAINGGALNGTGTVAGAVTIASGGTIQASSGTATGTLNITGALALNGTLNEVINSGSGFDAINASGSLTLGSGSTLNILLASGYDPAAGTSFTIGTYGALGSGSATAFGTIDNQTFNSGTETWSVAVNSTDIVLTAANVITPPTTVTATWNTPSSGNWTTAAEWSCTPGAATCVPSNGTPTNTNYAAVTNSAGNTLTLSTSETINTLTLQAGTLDIASGGNLNLAAQSGGITDIPTGAGLSLEGTFTAGSNSALAGLTSVEGTLLLDNGQTTTVTPGGSPATLTINGGSLTVSAASTNLTVNGNLANTNSGTLTASNSGTVDVTGNLTNDSTSTVQVQNRGSLSVSGNVTNFGNVFTGNAASDTGGNSLTVTGTFTNNAAGTFQMDLPTLQKDTASVGSFDNAGSVSLGTGTTLQVNTGGSYTQSGGSTTVNGTLSAPSVSINGGTVQVNDTLTTNTYTQGPGATTIGSGGTLTATTSYTQSAGTTDVNGTLIAPVSLSGGLLEGSGTIQGSVTQTGGTLQAGDPPGTLDITGNYTLSNSTYNELIGGTAPGTGYSVLDVTGSVNFVTSDTLIPLDQLSFTPTSGEVFDILNAGSISGTFGNNNIAFQGGTFTVDYNNSGCNSGSACVDLTWNKSTSATPEPASLLLLGTGLLGLAWAVRRKRQRG